MDDGEEQDSSLIGPMNVREASDYVHELEDLRPSWHSILQPIFDPNPIATEVIEAMEN